MINRNRLSFVARALGLAALTAIVSHAYELGGIAIHGTLSSTVAYSDKYNFLGATDDAWDFIQNEATVNATKRFDNGLKIAGQVYAYSLSDYSAVTLDFANLDYSFSQEFGVRIGRIKTPSGLYTEVQDLDQVRIFASLPLNFYPRSYRAFAVASDGVSLYGNLGAGKAGSFDYQAFYGYVPDLDDQQPTMLGTNSSGLAPNMIAGGSLIWNLPVDGLRVGYSYYTLYGGALITNPIDIGFGVTSFSGDLGYTTQVASIEYTRGKWVASAEYKYTKTTTNLTNNSALMGGLVPAGSIPNTALNEKDEIYFQLTYQATEKIGVGAYYAYSDYQNSTIDKDIALATSYAIMPWWLVKAEVHFMDGTHELGSAGNTNAGVTEDTWNYYVLKTTFSF